MIDRGFAKQILKDGGVKIYKKDIKNVTIHNVTVIQHAHGDTMAHRQVVMVELTNGIQYEALRETVYKDGNYSTVSAKWITREIREK